MYRFAVKCLDRLPPPCDSVDTSQSCLLCPSPPYLDLNLLDWSSLNLLVVCLKGQVYTWDASTGAVDQLLELSSPAEYVCSASWCADGTYLALGTSDSQVCTAPCLSLLTPPLCAAVTFSWTCVTVEDGGYVFVFAALSLFNTSVRLSTQLCDEKAPVITKLAQGVHKMLYSCTHRSRAVGMVSKGLF